LSSLYKRGKAQFVPEPTEVTKRQKVQAGAVSSGFKQMERKSKIKDKKSKLQVKKQKM